jgi:hypothetical protein
VQAKLDALRGRPRRSQQHRSHKSRREHQEAGRLKKPSSARMSGHKVNTLLSTWQNDVRGRRGGRCSTGSRRSCSRGRPGGLARAVRGRRVGCGKVLGRVRPLADRHLRRLDPGSQLLLYQRHARPTSCPQFIWNALKLFAAPASSQVSKKHLNMLLTPSESPFEPELQTQAGSLRELAQTGTFVALMQAEPQAGEQLCE